jgi:phosphatidylserine/phosphatidylglycerophosphate/cardiolipin synthase-like enzyme
MHDKYIVLGRVQGGASTPAAVLCGSTNFTENGVYRQANVCHVADDAALAGAYLAQFERQWSTAGDRAATKALINQTNPMRSDLPIFAGFSPRSGYKDIEAFVAMVKEGTRDVLFCTAFALHKDLLAALTGKAHDPVLRIGLQNTASTITGFHKDRTATFVAPALLADGLEGWLKESLAGQKGNIFIHTKMVVANFTTSAPLLLSGSHNLSKAASDSNDENYLLVRCAPGDTDIADAYGIELMRFYDHYRYRWFMATGGTGKKGSAKKKTPPAPTLDTTDAWVKPYFGGDDMKTLDRERFSDPNAAP